MKRIAVDAMGGEHAPQAIVDAVIKARKELTNVTFILFGNEEQVKAAFPKDENFERVEFVNTTEVIADSDEPVKAIRKKKDSSMVVAARYVKDKKADALISLGNTGALLSSGIFIIGRIKGVERPALMPTMPSQKGEQGFNIIDVGANAQSKASYLVQWAQMANYYAEKIRNVKHPKVALLNNGAEDDKGDPMHQEAYKLLSETNLNFTGNIEGNELMEGKADVVVTDGFTGNAVLKAIEGTASVILHMLKDSLLNSGLVPKIGAGLAKPALKNLAKRFDTKRYGGAVLLGVNGVVVKSHGRSDATTIYYVFKQVDKMLDQNLVEKYTELFKDEKTK